MIHTDIKATREGLVGSVTASGYIIDRHVPFIALPDSRALFKIVRVINQINKRSILTMVLDVGPWNVHDQEYIFGSSRPQAETGTDYFHRSTNKAGIDLSEHVWNYLEMKDNTNVDWEFVE